MTSLVSSRRVGCQGRSLLGPELVVVVLGMAEETRRQRLITRHDGYNQEVKKRMVVDSKIFKRIEISNVVLSGSGSVFSPSGCRGE